MSDSNTENILKWQLGDIKVTLGARSHGGSRTVSDVPDQQRLG